MKKFIIIALAIVFSTSLIAQNSTSTEIVKNYNNWKWDTIYVTKNKYISVAVVPDAGGRILEYNLGEVPSLWVNPTMFGKSFAATDEVKRDEWRNFGGYRLVPLPIENCAIDATGKKVNRWPPPAIIGDSPYSAEITTNSNGIKSINVASGIQNLPVPTYDGKSKTFIHPSKIDEKIQYKRSLYIEPNSSLVYINHTIINKGSETIKRGIMISSQHVSRSKPELTDGENFVAYVPFNKNLKLPNGEQYEITSNADARWMYVNRNRMPLDKNNPEHVKKFYNNGTNWTGEVAPGIFEMHYDYNLMSGFHIISSKSWVCYVNKINNTAFAKIMEPYNPKLEYDHGLNVSIFMSGLETGYLETEVKTPLYTLKPDEASNYLEIHGAAQITNAPVLDVNKAGIITKKLAFDSNTISGEYGVFIEGKAVLQLFNSSKKIIQEIEIENANPLKVLKVNSLIKKDLNIHSIQLIIKQNNKQQQLLDSWVVKN